MSRSALIFLRRHKLWMLLLVLSIEVVLRVFHVPQRITWLPEWPSYDQVLIRKAMGLFVPGEYMPGKYLTYKDDGLHGTRCNNRECDTPDFESATRVLCLGGSTTWGAGLSDEETYPAQLEKILNSGAEQQGRKYAVFNFGIPGTTSYYGAYKATRDSQSLRPDIVVVGYGGANDSLLVHFRESSYRPLSPVRRFLRSSQIYRLFEHTLYRFVFHPKLIQRVTRDEYRINIDTIYDYYHRQGVGVIFLTEHLLGMQYKNEVGPSPSDQKVLEDIMVRQGEMLGAPVVVAQQCIGDESQESFYLRDNAHWNEAGCRRIAECAAEQILKLQ